MQRRGSQLILRIDGRPLLQQQAHHARPPFAGLRNPQRALRHWVNASQDAWQVQQLIRFPLDTYDCICHLYCVGSEISTASLVVLGSDSAREY